MSQETPVWNHPDAGFSKPQIDHIPTFVAWLDQSELVLAKALAHVGESAVQLNANANQVRALESNILDERSSLSAAELDLQILGKAVAWMNRAGVANLPQPRLVRLFSMPKNPFRLDLEIAVASARAWLAIESQWVNESSKEPPVELVVLSAILHGGLWHKSSLIHFVRSILAPDSSFRDADVGVVCRLDLPWRGKPAMEKRYWRFDEHTLALLRPAHEYSNAAEFRIQGDAETVPLKDDELAKEIFKRIASRIRRAGIQPVLWPPSLSQMLSAVTLAARTEIPGILVDYSERSMVSHSLKPTAMTRLFALAETNTLSTPDDDKGNADSEVSTLLNLDRNLDPGKPNPDDIEPQELRDLREALRSKDCKATTRKLAQIVDQHPEDARNTWILIAAFASYLFEERHKYRRTNLARKRLAVSTVRAYTLTVARRLGRMLGSASLLDLNAGEIEDLYMEVLENATESDSPRRLRRAVALALREFHEFLVRKYGAAIIDDRAVFGVDQGLLPVDANIITIEEYRAAREMIRWDLHAQYSAPACLVAEAMLILGFRCGLRRMEAFGLTSSDLLNEGPTWLLIRPNERRSLKTANAQRQLPLDVLLPAEELAILSEIKRLSQKSGKGKTSLFACMEEPVSVDLAIGILHQALKAVTGDATLHYHHLRHSFATWTFTRLMLSDLAHIPDLLPGHAATNAWLNESKRFREQLYGNGAHTRKHAYAVASLLGHSGPSISFEHYVHSLEWLLPLFLSNSALFASTTAELIKASNIPASTAYVLSKRRLQDIL